MMPHRFNASSSAMMPQRSYNSAEFKYNNNSYNYNNEFRNNYNYNQHRNQNFISVNDLEAAQLQQRDSLYPHGESFSWVRNTDFEVERGLWPRPVWTHLENRSVPIRSGGYTGIQLLQAQGEDILTPSFTGLTDFVKNITPEPWQLMSPMWKPKPVAAIGSTIAPVKNTEKSTSPKSSGDQNDESLPLPDFSDLLST